MLLFSPMYKFKSTVHLQFTYFADHMYIEWILSEKYCSRFTINQSVNVEVKTCVELHNFRLHIMFLNSMFSLYVVASL